MARSRTRGYLIAHLGLGLVAPAAVLAHTGAALPASPGGLLSLGFLLASAVGVVGAITYRGIPRVLTRIERTGALPEDLAANADELRARLFREISGTSELVKRIASKILVPYARTPFGWVALAASGLSLGDEERRLRAQIDGVLDGRGADRVAGLDRVIRLAIELRALPGRRALTTALRGWMPVHVVLAAMTLGLLAVHVITAVGW